MKTYEQGFHDGVQAALRMVKHESSTLARLRREAARINPAHVRFEPAEVAMNELAVRIRSIRSPEPFDNIY